MKSALFLIPGGLFGVGLGLAEMTHPAKVLNFLDLAGHWDASLLFTMAGAMGTFALFNLVVHHLRNEPLFEGVLPGLRGSMQLDRRVVVGAILFGVGWGLSGVCPGPALADASLWIPEILVYILGMVVAMLLSNRFLGTDSD